LGAALDLDFVIGALAVTFWFINRSSHEKGTYMGKPRIAESSNESDELSLKESRRDFI
jgi:hypothetical protein